MKQYIIQIILLLPLILFSCKDEDLGKSKFVNRTIIVYMVADNNLSNIATENIQQIRNGYRNSGAKLIVYLDSKDGSPKLIDISDSIKIIKEYQECNSVSKEMINMVFMDVSNMYPSNDYGLILWSHGTSWLPSGARLRSFGLDDNQSINIPDLALALPLHFDFILFDACFMGSLEVAYELRNKTDYIIATSTETLAEGFPYEKIIPIMQNKNIDLKLIPSLYFKYYNDKKGAYQSATVSLIKTSELEKLAEITKKILQSNKKKLEVIDRTNIQCFDRYYEHYHFDFLDYINNLLPETDKSNLIKQLQRTILYKANTPHFLNKFDIRTYCGLNCYIPTKNRNDLNLYYSQLECYDAFGFNYLYDCQ